MTEPEPDTTPLIDTLVPAGGDGAITYIFEKGEAVPADHPAVKAFPYLFDPADD